MDESCRFGATGALYRWRFSAIRFFAVCWVLVIAACGGDFPSEPPEEPVVPAGAFLLKPYTGTTPPACDDTAPPAFGPLVAGDTFNVLVVALGEGGTGFSSVFDGLVELTTTDPNDDLIPAQLASAGCTTFDGLVAVTAGTGWTVSADTALVRGVRTSSAAFDVLPGSADRLAVRVIGRWNGSTPPNPAAAEQQVLPSASGPRVVGTPYGITAGQQFDVEVIVTDHLGNAVPGSPSVTVTAPFDQANVPAQNGGTGIYTFTIFRAAATQRISATDDGLVLGTGSTTFFPVGPDTSVAPQLTIVLPGQTYRPSSGGGDADPTPLPAPPKEGQSFIVQVLAVDPYGNTVTSATDSVLMRNDSAPGVRIPVPRRSLVSGVASFSLFAQSAGAGQQMQADGTSLGTGTSESFDIDPPDPIVVPVTVAGTTPGQGVQGGSLALRLDSDSPVPPSQMGGREFDTNDYQSVLSSGDGLTTSTSVPDVAQRTPRTGTTLVSAASPVPRSGLACAYDEARFEMVFFGGGAGAVPFDDTWEWDGGSLDPMSPVVTGEQRPAARSAHGMVYWPGLGVAVFGGLSVRGRMNDLWIWDGSGWYELPPGTPPSARVGAAVSFDTLQGVLVAFGGETDSGLSGELWVHDGSGWTQETAGGDVPAARTGSRLVYDSARGVHLLVGGRRQTGLAEDHYELSYSGIWPSGSWNWTRRDSVDVGNVPPGRTSHVAGYDSNRGVVIVFGGFLETTGAPGAGRIWEFDENGIDGPVWDTPFGGTLNPLAGAAACYDTDRQVFVIAGGAVPNASVNPDIYRWDGVSQTVSYDLTRGAGGPPARSGAAAAYLDTDSNGELLRQMVLFGGRAASGSLLNDLWLYDAIAGIWTEQRFGTNPASPSLPPPMENAELVEDKGRGVLVLYGGTASGGASSDIWDLRREWRALTGSSFEISGQYFRVSGADGNLLNELRPNDIVDVAGTRGAVASVTSDNEAVLTSMPGDTGVQPGADRLAWEWFAWTPSGSSVLGPPSARTNAAMAYDETNGLVVIFGGQIASSLSSETWMWDGTDWFRTQVSGFPKPSARSGGAMAYDPVTGQVILFGGQGPGGGLNDTWGFDGEYWTKLDLTGSAPPPMRDGVLTQVAPYGLVLTGGRTSVGVPVPGSWFWDGAEWYRLDVLGASVPPGIPGSAYDPQAGVLVSFGGQGIAASELRLTSILQAPQKPWEASLDQLSQNRYPVEIYDLAVTLPPTATIVDVTVTVVGGGLGDGGSGTDVFIQDALGVWDYVGGHGEAPRFCPADPSDPAQCELDRTVTGSFGSGAYVVNGHIRIAVSGATPSSPSVRALQSTDFVEVRVSYLP